MTRFLLISAFMVLAGPLAGQVSLVFGSLDTNVVPANTLFTGTIPASGVGVTNPASGTASASIWAQDSFLPGLPSTNATTGTITYTPVSTANSNSPPLRILTPLIWTNGVQHKFIMCLPVEPEPQTHFGEGIEYFRTNGLH